MNRHRTIFILTFSIIASTFPQAPSFAARAVQGSVANVTPEDAAALGPVGFRIWSGLSNGDTNTNDNVASCRNLRCMRQGYVMNSSLDPGGYISQQESTQVYNGDVPNQPFYELVDASMNDSAGNHIGFYGVSGVTANNSGVGNFLLANCPGTVATNCFGRIDNDDQSPILNGTNAAYGAGPHQIRPIGGMNPIPNVNVAWCGASVCLSWNDPPTYEGNMRPSNDAPAPPSPVKGVRLYKNFSADCVDPAGSDPGWTPIGSFALGQTSTSEPLPPQQTGCSYYALSVRLVGPGGDSNEAETFRVGAHSQGVGTSPTAVRIERFSAFYAGHGVVNVSWRSGVEGELLGYDVTRGVAADGPYDRVSGFLHAEGNGHDYVMSDHVPGSARTHYYKLQLIGRDGTVTTSGLAAVTLPARPRRARPSIR